jgi:hypothetical protein
MAIDVWQMGALTGFFDCIGKLDLKRYASRTAFAMLFNEPGTTRDRAARSLE